MTRRVLVTGATGLIGRMVVAELKRKRCEVVALGRSTDVPGADLSLVADLLDPHQTEAAIAQAQATDLVHLAWYRGAQNRWSTPLNLDWAAASLRLVRAFADHGGQRVVGLGSCAEYDWSDPILAEDTALNPASLYGKAKAATGTLLMDVADDLGLSLVWARLFFCYGPGEPKGRLLGDLLQGLAAGRPVDCTDGLQKRDFLHTEDVARAIATVLDSDATGAINIASGEATEVRMLIDAAARQMGRPDLINWGAIARPANDPPLVGADVARLRALGFQPKFDIETGVADCIKALVR